MTKITQRKRRRRSIRLRGYDYSLSGAYFVTICIDGGFCLLGDIVNGQMHENSAGSMIRNCWQTLPDRFIGVDIDSTVVMPNHLHGIIFLKGDDSTRASSSSSEDKAATRAAPTLGDIIGALKSISTNGYLCGIHDECWPAFENRLWQRNYWERIIRNERELKAIRQYIWDNPANWKKDKLYTVSQFRWR
jgi:putative transposase